jgi:hypothetical protein
LAEREVGRGEREGERETREKRGTEEVKDPFEREREESGRRDGSAPTTRHLADMPSINGN